MTKFLLGLTITFTSISALLILGLSTPAGFIALFYAAAHILPFLATAIGATCGFLLLHAGVLLTVAITLTIATAILTIAHTVENFFSNLFSGFFRAPAAAPTPSPAPQEFSERSARPVYSHMPPPAPSPAPVHLHAHATTYIDETHHYHGPDPQRGFPLYSEYTPGYTPGYTTPAQPRTTAAPSTGDQFMTAFRSAHTSPKARLAETACTVTNQIHTAAGGSGGAAHDSFAKGFITAVKPGS
ncbi:MAG: hypothetical protein KBD64_01535 [Gammaproteobacteria bacterium]|nr:hypothetical protein [Gammaproteobacteria bacterium]